MKSGRARVLRDKTPAQKFNSVGSTDQIRGAGVGVWAE